MTDLEKMELAVQRTASRVPGPWGWWLRELAKEIKKIMEEEEKVE